MEFIIYNLKSYAPKWLSKILMINLSVDPIPLSSFRVFDDSSVELDRKNVFGSSLLPRIAETEPVIWKLNLLTKNNW